MPAEDLHALPLADLRSRRARVRRAAEVSRLRARQGADAGEGAQAGLDAESSALTEELIARYAADLTLVDSLLLPSYPARGTERGEAGA